jgi:hypothetical protein
LFIAHGFNQLQRACFIQNSARITGKYLATLRSLGVLANLEEFQRQLFWARDHPHSQEAKSLNAKVSRILLIVGSTIPYSPFERAVTRPKLNAKRCCYGVGSNFITGAPPEFEDLLTLRLCMKPKYNDPNCAISKQGFTQSNLPDSICNKTSIRMRMRKQQPFLEAQNFHHKLQILLEAYIWPCTMKNSKGSSAVAKENNRGERQQPRQFVQQWSTTNINNSMGAASAAAKPLRNLSVGGEHNSKPAGGVYNRFLVA